MTDELNFKAICNLTTEVMGLPKGSLALRSRKKNLQRARAIASYIARSEENIKRTIIGKGLNRNRSMTYHYEETHEKNFKNCPIYRTAFNKIFNSYKDVDGSKKIFLDKDLLKSFLLQKGVKEKIDSDVLLEIKSGMVSCKIKTSYLDFSNQIENIKFAMQNYHYTINIF